MAHGADTRHTTEEFPYIAQRVAHNNTVHPPPIQVRTRNKAQSNSPAQDSKCIGMYVCMNVCTYVCVYVGVDEHESALNDEEDSAIVSLPVGVRAPPHWRLWRPNKSTGPSRWGS